MNNDLARRNFPQFPSFGGFSPFGSLLNSFNSDDIFNRGLLSGFKDAFDSDFGVKVKDTDDGMEYRFGLPGVAREHINVDIDGDFLTVQVTEKDDEGTRTYSSRVSLSPNANKDEVKAKYENGLLTIVVADKVTEKKAVTVHWDEKADKALESGDVNVNESGSHVAPALSEQPTNAT